MVFALLGSAIMWNVGTWYLGLPASSSHTLIGSIIGVGMTHSLIAGEGLSEGVELEQARRDHDGAAGVAADRLRRRRPAAAAGAAVFRNPTLYDRPRRPSRRRSRSARC